MKLNLKSVVLLSLCGLASLPVLAVTPDPSEQDIYTREFGTLDVDGNEQLSAAEIKKDPIFDDGGFGKADKNNNGSLSKDEFATYKSSVQQKEVKQVVSDSAITSEIKSKYLLEKGMKSFNVSVETKDGIVVLSGFVDSLTTKVRAEQIAQRVKGVKSVKSAIVVRP